MSKRNLILTIVGIVILICLGAGWMKRSLVKSTVVNGRVKLLVSRANSAFESGDRAKAKQLSEAALMLNPTHHDSLWEITQLGRKLNLPNLVQIQVVTFLSPKTSVEVQENILSWFLAQGNTAFFQSLLENLPKERRDLPVIQIHEARSLAMRDKFLEAIPKARQLTAIEETRERAELLLCELLPRLENNSIAWTEANQLIRKLIKSDDPKMALTAWKVIPQLPLRYRKMDEGFDHVAWIDAIADVSAKDRLTAHQLRAELLPADQRSDAIDEIQKQFGDEAESLSLLAKWLLDLKESKRLAELNPEPFRQDLILYTTMLQARIDAGKYKEADEWLKTAPANFDSIIGEALTASLAEKLGREDEALQVWRNAFFQIEKNQDINSAFKVLKIAQKFENVGIQNRTMDAILAFSVQKLPPSPSLMGLEEMFESAPAKWMKLWDQVVAKRSSEALAVEQAGFLKALVDPDAYEMAVLVEQLKPFVDEHPSLTRLETTYALLLALDDRPQESIELIKKTKMDWNNAAPYPQAVYAYVLHRAKRSSEAQALARKIDWDSISPIRRKCLSDLFQKPL